MSEFYGPTHRALQDAHDTRRLADRLEQVAQPVISPDDRAFIESRPMFFLSTVDERGRPTVSYKGGAPGFVRVAENGDVVFPSYDGNGMFLSLGNIAANPQLGMLFIDFESPRRLRLQGAGTVTTDDPLMASFPGARLLVRVRPSAAFPNCGRYIHEASASTLSPHVPDADGAQPFPAWKRVDLFQDALPAGDERRVAAAGGAIAREQYRGEDAPDGAVVIGGGAREDG